MPAARARIVELLTEAYARDNLDQAEFERRVALVEEAQTIEELDELVVDFPDHLRSAPNPALSPHLSAGTPPLTGDALESEIARLDGLSAPTTFNLLGDKRVQLRPEDRRVVRAVSVIGDCEVDLRRLAGAGGAVLVKVTALIGEIRLIVPRGTPVDIRMIGVIGDHERKRRSGGLFKKLARKLGVLDEAEDATPPPPAPPVIVTGFRLIGDTVIIEE